MVDCYIEINYMGMKRLNFRGLGDLISSQRDQKVRREEVNGEEEEEEADQSCLEQPGQC